MSYVPCIFHVYCSDKFFLSEFQIIEKVKQEIRDLKKCYEYMTIDIDFNLTINPLNIKIFTVYKIFSTEYIT